jgi:hypothetical protein
MIINGGKIVELKTLKSWYDMNSISVLLDNGIEVRMEMSTVLQMVNEFDFNVIKKRKWSYLTINQPEGE